MAKNSFVAAVTFKNLPSQAHLSKSPYLDKKACLPKKRKAHSYPTDKLM